MKAQRFLHLLCVATLAAALGCGGAIDPVASLADANDTNIKRLSNLYLSYQIKNAYRGPKNEEDFKGFLNAYSPKKLERIGIDPSGIDAIFFSERDGEPFKIRYGIPGSAMGSGEAVVFESTGVDGVRRVGFLNMSQRDVDPAEYEGLLSGSIKAAPPQRGLDPSEFRRAE